MKRILCYGDSNTYGHNPLNGNRLEGRWTKILCDMLGEEYEIIEEGLCGRTTVFDDNYDKGRNGEALIEPTIASHTPIDLIVIMLGTNDIQTQFSKTAFDIARGIETLIRRIKNPYMYGNYSVPKILVISPILIDISIKNSFFGSLFGAERAVELSKKLAEQYKRVVDLYEDTYFMNAADFASASVLDGLHMDSENHKKLAEGIAAKILSIFG